MKVLLTCTECTYQETGSSERTLMNKIIMWNHVKKAHPYLADRIMRVYNRVPDDLYNMLPALG
jgi:hypothetical protein